MPRERVQMLMGQQCASSKLRPTSKMHRRSSALSALLILWTCSDSGKLSNAFSPLSFSARTRSNVATTPLSPPISPPLTSSSHSSRQSLAQLNMVWFFGGTERKDWGEDDSCELVPVRIESPTRNSRLIMGEITVEAPLMDVWAILTDYDNLTTHVPNLVESKRVASGQRSPGEQGDGSYRCRLFQRGAQKIIGFEFGASVTMDMVERILVSEPATSLASSDEVALTPSGTHDLNMPPPPERAIGFRCVDSQFFSKFDGDWKVEEMVSDLDPDYKYCTLSYTVLVKPKGPVPVAALEWRIREDVPTNLRAVKKAATEVGYEGVLAMREGSSNAYKTSIEYNSPSLNGAVESVQSNGEKQVQQASKRVKDFVGRFQNPRTPEYAAVAVEWGEDETMAKYLND